MTPAPRSNPSSTTYAATMTATIMNQSVDIAIPRRSTANRFKNLSFERKETRFVLTQANSRFLVACAPRNDNALLAPSERQHPTCAPRNDNARGESYGITEAMP